jgi:hypothetical protein
MWTKRGPGLASTPVPSHWTWPGDTSLTCGGPDWLGRRLVSLNLAPERHSLSSVSFNLAPGGRSLGDVSGLPLAQPWLTLRRCQPRMTACATSPIPHPDPVPSAAGAAGGSGCCTGAGGPPHGRAPAAALPPQASGSRAGRRRQRGPAPQPSPSRPPTRSRPRRRGLVAGLAFCVNGSRLRLGGGRGERGRWIGASRDAQ